MHDRDLPGRATEADEAELQPEASAKLTGEGAMAVAVAVGFSIERASTALLKSSAELGREARLRRRGEPAIPA
jgi:hypothetical protein